ncbi:MAG: Rrf2 family transcriptional regulator [Bacteroidales bacterium]|nr:Rrf2 family transcriptional regulator [Bacteroidales bacterium]MDT8373069.1 Rrf2 family transcriptional regulator [Bacteroidales bacterium]
MLSKKTRYAIVALSNLAREYGKGPILIGELAKREKIPQRFLESILLELKREGILGSKLGKTGGYFLLRHPDEVSLLDIVKRFEGTISMLYCVSENSYQPCEFCKIEEACKIRRVFKDIRDNTHEILRGATLSSLITDTD